MGTSRSKLIVGTWFLAVLLAVPGISISQTPVQKTDDQRDVHLDQVGPLEVRMVQDS